MPTLHERVTVDNGPLHRLHQVVHVGGQLLLGDVNRPVGRIGGHRQLRGEQRVDVCQQIAQLLADVLKSISQN